MLHRPWFSAVSALALALVAALSQSARAGDAPALDPDDQPLAVIRLTDPAVLPRLAKAKPVRFAGMADPDYSGHVPGLGGVRVGSLLRLAGALTESGGRDLWFCLSQSGGTAASLTAALGWTWPHGGPASTAEATAWLHDNGVTPGDAYIETTPAVDGFRFVMARTAETALRLTGGGGQGEWRDDLRAFLGDADGGLGVWANPRPLSGFISLFGGPDPRRLAAAAGLAFPAAVGLDLFENGGDVGVRLRLARVADPADAIQRPKTLMSSRKRPEIETTVASSPFLLKALKLNANIAYPANLDLEMLLPRSLTLSWGRDGGWLAVGPVRYDAGGREQFRRLFAWMDVLSESRVPGLGTSAAESPRGAELRGMTVGGKEVHIGLSEPADGSGQALLFGAERAEDAVAAMGVASTTENMAAGELIGWSIRLDEATRREAAALLVGLLRQWGGGTFDPAAAAEAMPGEEEGGVRLVDGTLILESPRGVAVWLGPVAAARAEAAKRSMAAGSLAASRLRFLLAAAQQSRYREVGAGRLTAGPLPESLSALVAADSDGAAWLDQALPGFPGVAGPTSDALRSLAAGMPLDGYRYIIAGEGVYWRILAENGGGEALAVDAAGNMFKRYGPKEEWTEFTGPFF